MKRKGIVIFIVCLAFLILAGFMTGLIIFKELLKTETVNADYNTALIIVTEKYDNYIIADVVNAASDGAELAETVKIYVDPNSEFFADYIALQTDDWVRVKFNLAETFLDRDGNCVILKPQLLKKIVDLNN